MQPTNEQLSDPRSYQLEVTLREADVLVYSAEIGLPEGFKIPPHKEGAVEPVTLIRNNVQTKFNPLPPVVPGGSGGVEAIKLAWDFIKEGRPTSSSEGASTAVLATSDMAWEHYAGAEMFTGTVYQYRVKNGWGAEVVKIDYRARGSFKAQYSGQKEDVPQGDYMPSVEMYCTKVDVAWLWNVNAKATVSHLTNVGGVGEPVNPFFYITDSFNYWTLICNHTDTFPFKFQGDVGFAGKA